MVTVRFTHSVRDILRANAASNDAVPLTKWLHLVLWGTVFLMAFAIALDMVSLDQGVRWIAWPLLILLWLWVFSFWTAWMATRKGSPSSGERIYEFSPTGISISTPTSDSVIAWDAIMRTAETRTEFVFFTSELQGGFVPKRVLSPEDQSVLRSMIAAYSGREAGDELTLSAALPAPAVTVQYALERRELARAIIASVGQSAYPRVVFAIVLVVISLATLPAAYREWQAGRWQAGTVASIISWILVLLFILLLPRLIAHWTARRQISTGPSAQGVQSLGLADWGMRVSGPMYKGDFRWASFEKAVETPEFFLFFVNKLNAMFIPKRLLDREAREAVRAICRGALGSKAEFSGEAGG